MILCLICIATMQSTAPQASQAAEFFPIAPGTVRTYELKGSSTVVTNKIGAPVYIGSDPYYPITESGGGPEKTTYYRVDSDSVSVVAYDIKKPMPNPMPVLKVGSGKIAWDYQGKTQSDRSGERLLEHGEAHLSGQKMYLGKKVDTLTVKLAAALGVGASGETFDQTTVYGRGLGMVEQTTKMKLGKRTVEVTYLLTGIEAAK